MSSVENTGSVTNNGTSSMKKKKRKRSSPFRIKVGCIVALRYRPRGNNIEVELPDGTLLGHSLQDYDDQSLSNNFNTSYQDSVVSAQFSEVWTDPQPGYAEGLALVGSRIRCFFPKQVLNEPYNAKSRLLEGEVVNVVKYCEEQYFQQRQSWREQRQAKGILVDLLIDNPDNKQFKNMPFLRLIDEPLSENQILSMKESDKRSYQYEERIRGGKHKAIVRVLLSDESSSGLFLKRKIKNDPSMLEVKWVIRKRVPTKIVVRKTPICSEKEAKGSDNMAEKGSAGEQDNDYDTTDNEKLNQQGTNGNHEVPNEPENVDEAGSYLPKKRRKTIISSKDFSLPRYLGDGNDQNSQQEANWRWQAGKYNPCSVLADRPISKELLETLSYNFVGEVVRIQPETSSDSTTLATVTIRRLVLPEHTVTGRSTHHGPYSIFEDDDLKLSSFGLERNSAPDTERRVKDMEKDESDETCLLRVPIEELVIVRRGMIRGYKDEENYLREPSSVEEMTLEKSYSFHTDTYRSIEGSSKDIEEGASTQQTSEHQTVIKRKRCGRCRHLSSQTKRVVGVSHILCESCTDILRSARRIQQKEGNNFSCDCMSCLGRSEVNLLSVLTIQVARSIRKLGTTLQELEDYSAGEDSGFITTRFVAKGIDPVDFVIDPSVLEQFTKSSSSKPIKKIKPKKVKKVPAIKITTNGAPSVSAEDGKDTLARLVFDINEKEKDRILSFSPKKEVFQPTSSRLLPYDASSRKFNISAAVLYQWKMHRSSSASVKYPEKPRNLRHVKSPNILVSEDITTGEKKPLGRAARAKQRRLVKSVAAIGMNMDILSGREQQLRFDRSGIHDWGVFVDMDIREGELIVEYRGEIIGNAMAEKREQEYEAAKIGSDYMFRMDDLTVCDATKQGNVARFINASCDPNCHTKIISIDGTKRIVIYAKRDIKSGEELCYDYKFPLEYDPALRIPCRCGAKECRGFLNWDQRYADFPDNTSDDKSDTITKNARIKGAEQKDENSI